MAFGTVCFLSPNQIITGGGVGISLLLHALFP
ncbi:YitT family protein, partial [Aliarcobacter butzleri]|nr:YitT family protein [Aliarcobacter butzleri]